MTMATPWAQSRVGVLGLGRSGRAATRLLIQVGASVYASDTADNDALRQQAETLRASAPRSTWDVTTSASSSAATCSW